DPRSLAVIRAAATADAELVFYDGTGPERFDVLPLSAVTDGAVEAVGVDRRRFRPNILLAGVHGLEERNWVGSELRVGEARIGVRQVRARCVMTTFDPTLSCRTSACCRRSSSTSTASPHSTAPCSSPDGSPWVTRSRFSGTGRSRGAPDAARDPD